MIYIKYHFVSSTFSFFLLLFYFLSQDGLGKITYNNGSECRLRQPVESWREHIESQNDEACRHQTVEWTSHAAL